MSDTDTKCACCDQQLDPNVAAATNMTCVHCGKPMHAECAKEQAGGCCGNKCLLDHYDCEED